MDRTYDKFRTVALCLLVRHGRLDKPELQSSTRYLTSSVTLGYDIEAGLGLFSRIPLPDQFDNWIGMLELEQLVRRRVIGPPRNDEPSLMEIVKNFFQFEDDAQSVTYSLTANGYVELWRMKVKNTGKQLEPNFN